MPYILYSIRTDAFQQPMKKLTLPALWAETKQFLQDFTTAATDQPERIVLDIYPAFDLRQLGPQLAGVTGITGTSGTGNLWTIENSKLEQAIAGLEAIQEHLTIQPPKMELRILYKFYLKHKDNGVLPRQELQSSLELSFSKRHHCSPILFFPFSDSTPDFWAYLDTIKPSLPFELKEDFLRKMFLKDGNPGTMKKIKR
ncbi:hypothetical protein SAMN05428949_0203 [Chitinophaga sp. YR627]|uniref:hypothetical protein n=1 Tax=Chitinophaga sp. YR627 TaxID=1881041 RepID=UPI0008E7D8ED|nr:hypothetical protein [Chitinophaga sp. YR627]SFM62146.1 hypothetical protein SAMN05428949_0203 [Chitinophaga sp. YR627]